VLKRLFSSAIVRSIACWLISLYIRFARRTSRWKVVGGDIPNDLWRRNEPFILALWHGRLMMMPYSWQRGKRIDFLISFHRDGDLVARTIGHFGLGSIRGSSKKGGASALKSMVRGLRQGSWIGIAPDGPTGPRMRASEGIVSVARLAGVPIIPATCAASHRIVLGSWDRFLIPLPFSRGVFSWGTPITIARDADDDVIQQTVLQLEAALNQLTDDADRAVGQQPIPPAGLPDHG
jgi:lysophospholipid acyltransferase (LPLAT)-like uncharacterized protein